MSTPAPVKDDWPECPIVYATPAAKQYGNVAVLGTISSCT